MSEQRSSRQQVGIYLLVVFAFSSVFYFLMLRAHTLGAGGGLYVFGIMWCPALAAITTLKLNGRNLADLGWKWPQTNFAMQSWLIPLLYTTIAYVIVWSLAGSFGLVKSTASALGEEIGWRGFLVPELFKSTGFTGTALISGVVWSCWHYPLLIWGDYNSGTPTWYGLTCFTVMVISISFVFAWMRLKSGSLWTGALLHASHNLYVQGIFTPLTRNTGKTAWFIDEFGAILPLVVFGFGIYFWSRRNEVTRTA